MKGTNHFLAVWLLAAAIAPANPCSAASPETESLSLSNQKSITGGGGSYAPKFSDDGRYLVFLSHANNLVTNDDRRSFLDVFRHDLLTGETVLVSVNASGRGGGDDDSRFPDISADGRYISFITAAGNLVGNDTNGMPDVYVRDVTAGVTTLVTVDSNGTHSASRSSSRLPYLDSTLSANARISANGRKVIFESRSPELTLDDTNAIRDVFLRDLDTSTTIRVSQRTGFPTNSSLFLDRFGSFTPVMSPDGSRVAFVVVTNEGAAWASSSDGEIWVRDLLGGRAFWASSNAAGFFPPTPANYMTGCSNPVISANGQFVAFVAHNPYPLHPFSAALVLHQLETAQSTVISTGQGYADPAISADGRYVAFAESAFGASAIFRWDAQTQTKTLVSVISNGTARASHSPAMTPDGRFIVFVSSSSGLITNDVGSNFQVYVRDMTEGTTRLVSANLAGVGNADHAFVVPAINTQGTAVAFDSDAADLVDGDLNRASDVFVRDMQQDSTRVVSVRLPTVPQATGPAFLSLSGGALSSEGRFLLFNMSDGSEIPGDTNQYMDLFVHDRLQGTNISATSNPDGSATTNFTPRDSTLSGDGRFVVYVSAPGLPPWAFGQDIRLLRRDLQSGTDDLVATNPGFVSGVGVADLRFPIAVTADGNLVAFQGASAPSQIFVRDMAAGTTRLVSSNRFGTGACNNACTNPIFSPDGRWILFTSTATDLVTNVSKVCLYACDLASNVTQLASTGLNGDPTVGYLLGACFSADSRRVAFVSRDDSFRYAIYDRDLLAKTTALVAAPGEFSIVRFLSWSADSRTMAIEAQTNSGPRNIFVKYLDLGVTRLVSINRFGTGGGNSISFAPRLSANGRYVAFGSRANDLVPQDTNFRADIYLRDLWTGTTSLISANRDRSDTANSSSGLPILSADGNILAFQSIASDLVDDDFNQNADVFLLNLGNLDTDADGLDDAWEMTYFGDLSHDGNGDFDHDGATNAQEFRAGTDPTNSGSHLQVLLLTRPLAGITTATWSSVPGKSYRLQYKASVSSASWTNIGGDVTATGATASKDIPFSVGVSSQFFRVLLLP